MFINSNGFVLWILIITQKINNFHHLPFEYSWYISIFLKGQNSEEICSVKISLKNSRDHVKMKLKANSKQVMFSDTRTEKLKFSCDAINNLFLVWMNLLKRKLNEIHQKYKFTNQTKNFTMVKNLLEKSSV
jgi:hypothetical protein